MRKEKTGTLELCSGFLLLSIAWQLLPAYATIRAGEKREMSALQRTVAGELFTAHSAFEAARKR